MPPIAMIAPPITKATVTSPYKLVWMSLPNVPRGGAREAGAVRVEERARHRARLHREDLADRQVRGGGARRRGSGYAPSLYRGELGRSEERGDRAELVDERTARQRGEEGAAVGPCAEPRVEDRHHPAIVVAPDQPAEALP